MGARTAEATLAWVRGKRGAVSAGVAAGLALVGCLPIDDGASSAGACSSANGPAPVTVYDAVPLFGPTWWYVGQEPASWGVGGVDGETSGVANGENAEPIAEWPVGVTPPANWQEGEPEPGYDGEPEGSNDAQPDENEPSDPTQPADDGKKEPNDPNNGNGANDGSGQPQPGDPGTQSLKTLDLSSSRANGCYTCEITCTTKVPGPGQPRAVSTGSGMSGVSQAGACADAERHLKSYASSSYGLGIEACGILPTTPTPAPITAF